MEKIAVVFDLLGVITEEAMFATNIVYPLVRDKILYDLFKKKYLLYAIGNIEREEFWDFICPPEKIKFFEEKFIEETKLSPDVGSVIKRLLDYNCELFLATEIPRLWGELLLKKASIANVFSEKFYSSDLQTTKPFAKFYKTVFQRLDNPSIYYIDDTLINLISAKKYKDHQTIYYTLGDETHSTNNVDYNIDNLNELLRICETKK